MYESRRLRHRNSFGLRLDPVMLALLGAALLLGVGFLVGHIATTAVESAAEIQAAIYR